MIDHFKIIEFNEQYTEELIQLILAIQVKEFGVNITRDDQPDLIQIPEYYQVTGGQFWLALYQEQVVGTIALKKFTANQAAVRKMFVAKEYRGTKYQIAQKLLDNLLDYARDNQVDQLYLGTVEEYLAAHRFYEKNGFIQILSQELPVEFPRVAVDNRFYCKNLGSTS